MTQPERLVNFHGHYDQCEHRTVGPHRAWCYDCREWCYPHSPCVRCVDALESPAEIERLHEKIESIKKALPPPDKLETLANYLDTLDRPFQSDEVQRDLREWARRIREVMT